MNATGMPENVVASKTGGGIAKKAKVELEAKTDKKVVTGENYLPVQHVRKKLAKETQKT